MLFFIGFLLCIPFRLSIISWHLVNMDTLVTFFR